MILIVTMLACACVLAVLVYRYDMYEKEPRWLLALTVVLGMGAGWGAGIVEDFLIVRAGTAGESLTGQSAAAAGFEEAAKLVVVLLIACIFQKEFNDPSDGLIYGAFAGLGAAVVESLFYMRLSSTPYAELVAQESVRLLLHLLMGGIAGFGFGMAWMRLPRWKLMMPAWIASAMVLHFSWDYICGLPSRDAAASLLQRLTAIGLMLAGTALFGISVFVGARRSRRLYAPQSPRRLWGWPFSLLFKDKK